MTKKLTLEPPRTRPEWEEVPETVIVADEVEGTNVDSTTGEGKPKITKVKVACQERKVEKKKSPKRKVILAESEETQDYVGEAKSTDQEEVEELSFVPSAISVPHKMIVRCDNQCSEKPLSFWQLASVVIKEGEESYTTNSCQRYYNDSLRAKGENPQTNVQWREFAEQKAHRGRLWKMW